MNEKEELRKRDKLERRELIDNILKFLCFLVIYMVTGERILLYIGVAYLLYATTRMIVLCRVGCKIIDIYIKEKQGE